MNTVGQCTGYDMNYSLFIKINMQSHDLIRDVYTGYNHNLCISGKRTIFDSFVI